jgi:hypothetical protein
MVFLMLVLMLLVWLRNCAGEREQSEGNCAVLHDASWSSQKTVDIGRLLP